MFRSFYVFLIAFIMLVPAMAGDFAKEVDGLTPEQWADKIIEELTFAQASEAPYWGDKYPLNRLYTKLSYSNLQDIQSNLDAYISAAEASDSIRHKTIADNIKSTYFDYEPQESYPASEDWFVLAQNIANNSLKEKGVDTSLLGTLELLMQNHEADPAYPMARIVFHYLHSVAATDRLDLVDYLSHAKEIVYWTKYYWPEKDWTLQLIPTSHSPHIYTFNHPSAQKLLDYIIENPIDHEIARMAYETRYAIGELQFGDAQAAYDVLEKIEPFEKSKNHTHYVAAYAMIAAVVGESEVAQEKIDIYNQIDPTFYHPISPMLVQGAKTILGLDSPSKDQIRGIIDIIISMHHVRRDGYLNKSFGPSSSLNPEISSLRLGDGISDIFYAGRPVSAQEISDATENNFQLLKTAIAGLMDIEGQNQSTENIALARYFHDLMGKVIVEPANHPDLVSEIGIVDFLDKVKISDTQRNSDNVNQIAYQVLGDAVLAWRQNDIQKSWELIEKADVLNKNLSKHQTAVSLISRELELDLLASEANTEELFEKSIQLLSHKNLSTIAPNDTISSVLYALASAYEGRGQIYMSRRILSLDPRLTDSVETMPFQNIFLASWLSILSEDWSAASILIPATDLAAKSVEEELLAQALQYIMAPRSDVVVDPENIKTTILTVLDSRSAKLKKDELLYYMAFGDLINTQGDDIKLVERRTKTWNTIARKRAETLRSLQSKAANDRNIAKTTGFDQKIDTLSENYQSTKSRLTLASLLALLGLGGFTAYFSKFRRARENNLDLNMQAEDLSEKQSIFAHYINDIQTINDQARTGELSALGLMMK